MEGMLVSTSKIYVFRYQPELEDSVIYWSLTFSIFFISMIGLMEQQGKINIFSSVLFVLFLLFFYLGSRRKIILTNQQIKVSAILRKNEYTVDLSSIENMSVGGYGVTLTTNKEEYSYLLFVRSKNRLVTRLKEEENFIGMINGKEKDVD